MSTSKTYMRWTREDKIKLLHGLKVYGYRDLRNISKLIPNKSPGAIRTMIYKYTVLAKEASKLLNPLDEWMQLNTFKDNNNSMLSEALLYISLYEDHPPPSETGGINISAFYEMFYAASTNHTLPNLTPKDIEALNNLHEVLNLKMDQSVEGEVLKYLHSISDDPVKTPMKVYSKKQK